MEINSRKMRIDLSFHKIPKYKGSIAKVCKVKLNRIKLPNSKDRNFRVCSDDSGHFNTESLRGLTESLKFRWLFTVLKHDLEA